MRTVRIFDEQRIRLLAEESILTVQRIGAALGSESGPKLFAMWRAEIAEGQPVAPRPERTADDIRRKGIKVFSPPPAAPAEGNP